MQRLNKDPNALRGTHYPGNCQLEYMHFKVKLTHFLVSVSNYLT